MKIVNEQPFNYKFTCRGCKSELIAEADDVLVGYFGAGPDRPERLYYVACPVCETKTTLKHADVTPKVRAMADRKEKKR